MINSLLVAALGTLIAALVCLVPALHVYSVAGLVFLLVTGPSSAWSGEMLSMLLVGMVTGYAMLNTIPGVFLSAPDESTVFVVLPAQEYLLQRRGYEAAVLSGLGGLGGTIVLTLLTPVAPAFLPALRAILQPHLPWIIWAIIAYLLLSEWPKGSGRPPAGWRRWWDGWRSLTAGFVTFLLSGLLGFVLLYRSPVPMGIPHQSLLPAFVGLFAVPQMVQNALSRVSLPRQHVARTLDASLGVIIRGILAGALGGLFAAFFPVVTAGIGGLLAGQATAQRDDRLFLISQGAAKMLYYGGGLLLFFVPGLHLTRGGMAWMLSTQWSAHSPKFYYAAVGGLLASGLLSFFLLLLMAQAAIRIIDKVNYPRISTVALTVLLIVVIATTGWSGLLVCGVATGIGLIPALWGSRRLNGMGVLLLPLAFNMAGWGAPLARWLGLV